MEDENSWVFDSLVCFLNGPIWNAPLQNFIEEKSLIFEPNVDDNEEYKKIFDEFKNLVDFMLGNFMEDIGITPEQFENACKEGRKYQVSFDHNLFEQIWAANDYDMFKRMMAQRNVELQLQALELIERKYGITPQSFIPKTKDENAKEIPVTIEKTSDLENDVMHEVDELELKKRQQYLRAQRDKLVALKKEARKKQLNAETTEKPKERPRSAKAAEAVMTGERPNVEPQQLQIRKTLAERLKSEVVNKELK
ncbi:hypothetical protein NQ318_004048 [Aromia moschata]|uniref:Cilia- and flagella-associated protein 36 n=1 Tax=Aromia moschata TaxID=1265417 RepID=A0AAV8Z9J7_9CUCU|nr:hypothetical protein NQ318_004048 [Aromia moschata]